ncbi:endonuclease III [Candidatus Woesearchaeota archaeon]|nr:endonuclease III [Candidatus Woesearchaeota archaeon]
MDARQQKVVAALEKAYPGAKCALRFSNALECLVATILSAQCTDGRVNLVTQQLFGKYRSAKDYASAPLAELEQDIRSTGFYRNKAKSIQGAARLILEKSGGKVPRTMPEALQLPGVARKTANIVLGNSYGVVEGIAVDTHVMRLSQRLGFSREKQPEKIEQDLMQLLPREKWFPFTYVLIDHGRQVCNAKKPVCSRCVVEKLCPKTGVTMSA